MELIVQPADGVKTAARDRRGRPEINRHHDLPFRSDADGEGARGGGVAGVVIRALIARESSQGDKRLRQLEMRMLEKGIIVARTGDAFVRYHGKMMIVDRQELHVYGFNYTRSISRAAVSASSQRTARR